MNRKQLGAFVGGALTIIGGGCVAKYLDPIAGAALVAAGAGLIGLAKKQPRVFHAPVSRVIGPDDKTPVLPR